MKKINIPTLITIVLLIICVLVSMFIKPKDTKTVDKKEPSVESQEEMRGLWVSFITLDMSDTDRSYDSFKLKFNKIIEDAKKYYVNTLIVQVRPFSDALYYSDIYPHSHVLSGTQGISPEYDALEYMCSEAHKNNLKIHAWINPYRISTKSMPSELVENNLFNLDDLSFETESGKYLNPSKKEVWDLITQGVLEIIKKYPVDGIQFDDYFYPTDCGNFDIDDFNQYLEDIPDRNYALSYEKWRQNNVNLLISQVYRGIKNIKPEVLFGLAPQGNIENDYLMGADVKSWCEIYGYVDYICPQMYYSIENPGKSFEDSLNEWNKFSYHKNIKKYIGLGAYKAGTDADEGTWINNPQELKNQLKLLREYGYDGYMIYDYSALNLESAQEALSAFKSII